MAGRRVALAAATLLVAGCGGGVSVGIGLGDDGFACTLEARPSVALTVTDAGGTRLPGVSVMFRRDGGAPQTVDCDAQAGGAPCVLAWEQPGRFDFEVRKPGWRSVALAVDVAADVCHVATQSLHLTLVPA